MRLSPAGIMAARRSARLLREGREKYQKLEWAAAEPILRDAMEQAVLSGGQMAIADAADLLYRVLNMQRRYAEAAEVMERKFEAHVRMQGRDSQAAADCREALITRRNFLREFDALLQVCQERLESDRRRFGERSLEVAWAEATLGWALRRAGKLDEAEEQCRRAVGLVEALQGAKDPRLGWPLTCLAYVRYEQGAKDEYEALLLTARDGWDRVGHGNLVAEINDLLIALYIDLGRPADALPLSERWFGNVQWRSSADDERKAARTERHAQVLRAVGREAEAARYETRAKYQREHIEGRVTENAAARERAGQPAPDTERKPSYGNAWIGGPVFPTGQL